MGDVGKGLEVRVRVRVRVRVEMGIGVGVACAGQRPRPERLSFLSRFASRFSLSDLPGFFPAGFWGDFSGMWLSLWSLR